MTAVLRDDEDDRSTPRRHDDPAVSISVRSAVRTRQRAADPEYR